MDQLQSELLLSIFKKLDSNEMVKVTRVCKTWFDIINQNQSPWRSLVLPDRKGGWDDSIIELFDRKSQSTLQTVLIKLCEVSYHVINEKNEYLKATLERSKNMLLYLHLSFSGMRALASLQDLSWKLPNLVHCVIGRESDQYPTRIVQNSKSREPSSGLRTLWIFRAPPIFHSHLHIIDKVASLHVEFPLSSSEWRKILEKPAQTLRDLKINLNEEAPPRPQSSLDFPNLRVLQLGSFSRSTGRFPSWLKIPSSSTFIAPTYDSLPKGLLSVSTVWVKDLLHIRKLKERYPVLAELRIDSGYGQIVSGSKLSKKVDLYSLLRKRKKRVKNGAEVDGVKMIPLETLIVNFHEFTEDQISLLRGKVKEVIDLNSVDRFIEVEI